MRCRIHVQNSPSTIHRLADSSWQSPELWAIWSRIVIKLYNDNVTYLLQSPLLNYFISIFSFLNFSNQNDFEYNPKALCQLEVSFHHTTFPIWIITAQSNGIIMHIIRKPCPSDTPYDIFTLIKNAGWCLRNVDQ